MDAIDRRLVVLLEHDPRITFREIGEQLNVSTPTAQRRVEHLFSSGRLRSIRYRLSVEVLGGRRMTLVGLTNVKLTPEVIDGLRDQGSIYKVYQLSYSYVACWVDLRHPGDEVAALQFLKDRLGLNDPLYHILNPTYRGGGLLSDRKDIIRNYAPVEPDRLTSVDLKIVRQLAEDGRMPISDIARKTGLSARTIGRRIEFLTSKYYIDAEPDWYLGIGDDIWFAAHVDLTDPAAKDDFFSEMARFDGHLLTSGWDFATSPTMITFDAVFQSQKEVYELVTAITRMKMVKEMNHTVFHMSHIFETWVHKMSKGEMPLPWSLSKK